MSHPILRFDGSSFEEPSRAGITKPNPRYRYGQQRALDQRPLVTQIGDHILGYAQEQRDLRDVINAYRSRPS